MAATRLAREAGGARAGAVHHHAIGDEPQPAYNRIQLSPVLGGEKRRTQIQLLPTEWYAQHGVRVRLGEAVSEVDVAGRRLRVGGDWLEWDELVFATGSQPFIPSLPGIERPQVFAFAPWRM
ncbi:hypothetical protein UA44_23530 [Klebsiella aerogenes]|nr:hypothetical protein UA44_23530 [Klebsiella aerogenes]